MLTQCPVSAPADLLKPAEGKKSGTKNTKNDLVLRPQNSAFLVVQKSHFLRFFFDKGKHVEIYKFTRKIRGKNGTWYIFKVP